MNSTIKIAATSQSPQKVPLRIHVLTVLTKLELPYMLTFCHVMNSTIVNIPHPITILSFPVPGWKLRNGWENVWKFEYALDFMLQPDIKDDDIILFFDARDAFFLTSIDNIVDQFIQLNSSILFSAEGHLYPDGYPEQWPPVPNGHPRFLNSGGYIGYVYSLKSLFKDILYYLKNENDDQKILHYYYHKHLHKISIDSNITIFQNMFEVQLTTLKSIPNDLIENSFTHNNIKIIHFNGFGIGDGKYRQILPTVIPFLKHANGAKEKRLQQLYSNATFIA